MNIILNFRKKEMYIPLKPIPVSWLLAQPTSTVISRAIYQRKILFAVDISVD